MHRCAILALGFATLILASCSDEPPVIHVSGGGEAAQALGYQLGKLENQVTALQNQVTTLQRRIDGLEAAVASPLPR
jgi:hypothetical protein